MLDRESTFANPEIVQLLKTEFIPVAIDQANQRRQQDPEGEFYRKIAGQGPRNDFKKTTQGLYIASADGTLLGYTNHRDPKRVMQMVDEAREKFHPAQVAGIDRGKSDERFSPELPDDGLIVRVQAKVLGGYKPTDNRWKQIFQSALSRDNLWITGEEHAALVDGRVAESLQRRIARFHLVDNTRGEPNMWKDDEIESVNMSIEKGTLIGSARLQTESGDRSFDCEVFGEIKTENGKVTRLDIVAKGEHEGEGHYTGGAPKGKFPLAISFTLADGTDIADGLPPQGARHWLTGYIGH